MLKTRIKKHRLTHNKHSQGESRHVFRKKGCGEVVWGCLVKWSPKSSLWGLLLTKNITCSPRLMCSCPHHNLGEVLLRYMTICSVIFSVHVSLPFPGHIHEPKEQKSFLLSHPATWGSCPPLASQQRVIPLIGGNECCHGPLWCLSSRQTTDGQGQHREAGVAPGCHGVLPWLSWSNLHVHWNHPSVLHLEEVLPNSVWVPSYLNKIDDVQNSFLSLDVKERENFARSQFCFGNRFWDAFSGSCSPISLSSIVNGLPPTNDHWPGFERGVVGTQITDTWHQVGWRTKMNNTARWMFKMNAGVTAWNWGGGANWSEDSTYKASESACVHRNKTGGKVPPLKISLSIWEIQESTHANHTVRNMLSQKHTQGPWVSSLEL